MAEVIKEWDGFELTAPPLNGAEPVRGLKRGRAVSAGELLARHPNPLRGDVHAPCSGIVTEINEFEIIVQRGDQVVGEPPQPRDLHSLNSDELAAAFKELGLERPEVNPGDALIINTLNPEPGLSFSAALFSEHIETMLAGVEAAMRLWPGRRVVWAVPDKWDAPAGEEFYVAKSAFPETFPTVLKKRITGFGGPVASGVLGGRELYFLGRIWRTGLPITRMVLSLGASSYFVPVGSRAADLLTFANLYPHDDDVVVKGGLVRGTTLARLGRGLEKTASALNLVRGPHGTGPMRHFQSANGSGREAAWAPKDCLGCGSCAHACPVGLPVTSASSLYPQLWLSGLARRLLDGCLACGACALACPAGRPLISMLRLTFPEPEVWI
ncbi:hypothetical protein C4J81_10280 [Deltaproteobacteria bacterium Smac51]|nr:hypothetical protein C4J81_10280 [Deltaproteobacteria bacterium Smac51]